MEISLIVLLIMLSSLTLLGLMIIVLNKVPFNDSVKFIRSSIGCYKMGVYLLKIISREEFDDKARVDDLLLLQDKDSLELSLQYKWSYDHSPEIGRKRLIAYVKKSDLLKLLSEIEK